MNAILEILGQKPNWNVLDIIKILSYKKDKYWTARQKQTFTSQNLLTISYFQRLLETQDSILVCILTSNLVASEILQTEVLQDYLVKHECEYIWVVGHGQRRKDPIWNNVHVDKDFLEIPDISFNRDYPIKCEVEIKDIIAVISFDTPPNVTSILNSNYICRKKGGQLGITNEYKSFFEPRFNGQLRQFQSPSIIEESDQSGSQQNINSSNENNNPEPQNFSESQTETQNNSFQSPIDLSEPQSGPQMIPDDKRKSQNSVDSQEAKEEKTITIGNKNLYVQYDSKQFQLPIKEVSEAMLRAKWIPKSTAKREEFYANEGFYPPFSIFDKIDNPSHRFFVTKLEDWNVDFDKTKINATLKDFLDVNPPYQIGFVLHDEKKEDSETFTGMIITIVLMIIDFSGLMICTIDNESNADAKCIKIVKKCNFVVSGTLLR